MDQIAQIALSNHLANTNDDSEPYTPTGHHHQQHPGSAKRKADDDGSAATSQGPQQRAKRNRYISIACNECKRRKIKCNGQTPCNRCGNLNLECVYAPNCCAGFKDSSEYRDMMGQIQGLREHVHNIWREMEAMRAQLGSGISATEGNIDPTLQSPFQSQRQSFAAGGLVEGMGVLSPGMGRRKSQSQSQSQPTFRGPTSSVFNFGVARNSLQTMGITSHEDTAAAGDSGEGGSATREVSPEPAPVQSSTVRSLQVQKDSIHANKDPIWAVSEEEAIRLCLLWEDEMGMMYPILDIGKVIAYAKKLYMFMNAARKSGFVQEALSGPDAIDDEDTNILKMVLATGLTVEASGRSELGQRIFEYVHPAIDNLLLGNVGVKGIRLLVLTAMYEFHRDNESTSWRIIGMTARLCIELGLHQRGTYEAMQDDAERSETILLFWAIYVLDRRWSFGTGMPFALQDQDIDPLTPKPEDRSPYLSAMIQYSAISAKVWRSLATRNLSAGGAIDTEEMSYLDYQVINWHRNIPVSLRFEHPSQAASNRLSTPIGPPQSRAAARLRAILYIRANQMRILIYRPVLHSATSILTHRPQAQTVIDVAKDTIRVLTHINQTSDLYRTQQILFNAFLTSALAVLFLAVAHTPAEFAEEVREEFYMAVELVRGLKRGSWVSRRLWKIVRGLKEVAPRLGLGSGGAGTGEERGNQHERSQSDALKRELDPNRSAAVAMAGLAGHNVDELALFQSNDSTAVQNMGNGNGASFWPSTTPGANSSSPENMANDLTSLFEAAGGYQAMGRNGNGGGEDGNFGVESSTDISGAEALDNMAGLFEGDEALNGIWKEVF